MYIRGFDGLRAVAVILVFFTHKTVWGEQSQVGFAGVWLFFLLSGFLITGQLHAGRLRLEQRQASLRQEVTSFWIKRALRIFPAYYVLLALLVPYYLLGHRDIPGFPYYATYLSNFFFQAEPQQFLTTFAHFWSLAVEEQYYIFFAPLLLLVPSRFAAHACALVVVASLIRRFWLAQLDIPAFVVYIDSIVNFGILALGGLMYLRRAALLRVLHTLRLERSPAGWIYLLLLLATPPTARWLAASSLPRLQLIYIAGICAGALLLLNVYFNQRSVLTKLLECRPIVYLGRISYGLYLYNDYVKADLPQRLLRRLFADSVLGQMMLGGLGLIVCMSVLVAVAQVSWMLIEEPALNLRNRLLADRPRLPSAIPANGDVGALGLQQPHV